MRIIAPRALHYIIIGGVELNKVFAIGISEVAVSRTLSLGSKLTEVVKIKK